LLGDSSSNHDDEFGADGFDGPVGSGCLHGGPWQ